jgi:arylsulfatase A-like enzyme
MYEEAIRMSLKIRRPEYIQEAPVNNDMVVNIDFAPTIIDMAGVNATDEMQGSSLVPLLKEEIPKNWRTAVYYHYWQHRMHRNVTVHYGIRTKNRKLIFFMAIRWILKNWKGMSR